MVIKLINISIKAISFSRWLFCINNLLNFFKNTKFIFNNHLFSKLVFQKKYIQPEQEFFGRSSVTNSRTKITINLFFNTIEEGVYTFVVISLQGRLLESQTIKHSNNSLLHTVILKNKLTARMYYIKVENGLSSYITSIIITE